MPAMPTAPSKFWKNAEIDAVLKEMPPPAKKKSFSGSLHHGTKIDFPDLPEDIEHMASSQSLKASQLNKQYKSMVGFSDDDRKLIKELKDFDATKDNLIHNPTDLPPCDAILSDL